MNVTRYQITYLDLDRGTNSRQVRVEDCYIGPCYALIDVDMEANHWNTCIASNNQGNILGLQNCQQIGMIAYKISEKSIKLK